MASPGDDRGQLADDLIELITNTLRREGVRYLLIGGQAVNLLPIQPRVTFDIDFTVIPGPGALERVRDELLLHGFTLVHEQSIEAGRGLDFVRLNHGATGLGLDLEAASTEFEEEAVTRGSVFQAGQVVPSATPEDLIIFKMIANRHKDQADLFELLKLEGLDWAYLRRWAIAWELEERLDALLQALARDTPAGPP